MFVFLHLGDFWIFPNCLLFLLTLKYFVSFVLDAAGNQLMLSWGEGSFIYV